MNQKSIKTFLYEIYSKAPKKNYATNKTDVFHIDNIWSLDVVDVKEYGPENIRGYRFVLVIIDNFSKIGSTTPLINKTAQTIKDSFENILKKSKRKPNLIEKERGKEFCNNIFQGFLNNNNIKLYSRKNSYGAVFAENVNGNISNLLKRPVFEKGEINWIEILQTITKQNNSQVHACT